LRQAARVFTAAAGATAGLGINRVTAAADVLLCCCCTASLLLQQHAGGAWPRLARILCSSATLQGWTLPPLLLLLLLLLCSVWQQASSTESQPAAERCRPAAATRRGA
jgi:hypothetical protein